MAWTRGLVGLALAGVVVGLAACGAEPDETAAPLPPPPPDATLVTDPEPPMRRALPEAVIATRDTLLETANARSLRRLGRFADSQEAFLSNLGNDEHYDHWYLMRATGFDVLRELETLFEEPYGVKQVGSETWFIWPDLAALEGDALVLERLSFRDRARLKALVGDVGIDAIAAGEPYPGIRTAIAEDGGWRYFLHENGLKAEDEEDDGNG
ncbi:MAG: hypothetical protein AAF253_03110 [Pseudomonadota bacterium]